MLLVQYLACDSNDLYNPFLYEDFVRQKCPDHFYINFLLVGLL